MKITRLVLLLFALLTLMSPFRTFSQTIIPSDYNSWAMGVKFGMLPFYGDVRMLKYTPDNKYRKTNTGFAFEGIKNLNHIFGLRADLLLAGLSGSSINLNKHFTAGIKEFSFSGIVNLNDLISFYPEREKVINAYIYAGFGAMSFRSKVYSYDENAFLDGFGWDSTGLSKTKGRTEMSFPIGVGIKFKADPKIDIGLEYTLHLTNTDKLDAWMVGKSYMDRYGYAAVSITYKLGNKKEYVDWVNPFQDTTNVFASNENQINENEIANNNTTVKQNTNIGKTKTNKDTTATNNQTKTNSQTASNNQTVKNNQTVVNNQTVTNNQATTNNTQTTIAAEESYFIVSGAYKTKKLAKEAVAKLKSKGYDNARILGESSSGSWRVSLKGFTAMEDAIAEISGIKKTYPYAKLFEKKGEKDFSEISSKIVSKLLTAQSDSIKTLKTTTSQTAVTNTTKTNTATTANTTTANQNTVTANTNNTTITNTANPNKTISNTSNTNTNNTASNNTSTQNTSTAVNNTNATTNATTNNSTTTTNNTSTTSTTVVKKFYIIASSFPTEQQANDAVAELKAKGFPNAEVVGKNDLGSFRICYKGYATREEAAADLPGIKQSTNPSAWIFEKK